jgi:hypothetical protein
LFLLENIIFLNIIKFLWGDESQLKYTKYNFLWGCMKNINLLKGALSLLIVQLFFSSMLQASEGTDNSSEQTRGNPIVPTKIILEFTDQTENSVKIIWDSVAQANKYTLSIDSGAVDNLGDVTSTVIPRTTPGAFTVEIQAWRVGATDDYLGTSGVITTTTSVRMPGYALSWDETDPVSISLKDPKQVIPDSSDFTIEFWVKAEALETGIFSLSTNGGLSMKIEDDGDLLVYDGTDLINPVASASGIIDLKDPNNPPSQNPPPATPWDFGSNHNDH